MKHINGYMIGAPAAARYAVMKRTAFGLIDMCRYHESIGDAFLDLLELPTANYEIAKIDREEVRA